MWRFQNLPVPFLCSVWPRGTPPSTRPHPKNRSRQTLREGTRSKIFTQTLPCLGKERQSKISVIRNIFTLGYRFNSWKKVEAWVSFNGLRGPRLASASWEEGRSWTSQDVPQLHRMNSGWGIRRKTIFGGGIRAIYMGIESGEGYEEVGRRLVATPCGDVSCVGPLEWSDSLWYPECVVYFWFSSIFEARILRLSWSVVEISHSRYNIANDVIFMSKNVYAVNG